MLNATENLEEPGTAWIINADLFCHPTASVMQIMIFNSIQVCYRLLALPDVSPNPGSVGGKSLRITRRFLYLVHHNVVMSN